MYAPYVKILDSMLGGEKDLHSCSKMHVSFCLILILEYVLLFKVYGATRWQKGSVCLKIFVKINLFLSQ